MEKLGLKIRHFVSIYKHERCL